MANGTIGGYQQSLDGVIAKQAKRPQARPEPVTGLEKATKITTQYFDYAAKSGPVRIYFGGEGFYIEGKDYKNPVCGNPGPVIYPVKSIYLNGKKETDSEEIIHYLTAEEQKEAVKLATATTEALKNIQPLYFADDNGIIQKDGPRSAKITIGGNEYIAWHNHEPSLCDDKGFYCIHTERSYNRFDGMENTIESRGCLSDLDISFVEKNQLEVRRYFQMSSRGGMRRQRIDAPQTAEKINDNQAEEKSAGWVEHYKGNAYMFVFRDENNRPYVVITDPVDKLFGKGDGIRWLNEDEVQKETVFKDDKGYYFLDKYPIGTFRRNINDTRYIHPKE